MSELFKKLIAILITVLIVVFAVRLVKKRKAEIENEQTPVIPQVVAKVVVPEHGTVIETVELTGKVEAVNKSFVSTKIPGKVEKIYVREGDYVKRGEPLIKIDDREILSAIGQLEKNREALVLAVKSMEDSLRSLEIDRDFTEERFNRVKKLYEAGAVSKEQFDGVKTELSVKNLKIKSLKKSIEAKKKEIQAVDKSIEGNRSLLSYLKIVSPVDGVVGTVFIKEGSLAVTGKPILVILSSDKKLTFAFPKEFGIKPGQKVLTAKGEPIGVVKKIYPESFGGLPVAEVKVEKGSNFKDGEILAIKVILKEASGTTVPLNALIVKKDAIYVVVKEGKSYRLQKVNVIAKDKEKAVISPDIKLPVAVGSESKLLRLVAGGEV